MEETFEEECVKCIIGLINLMCDCGFQPQSEEEAKMHAAENNHFIFYGTVPTGEWAGATRNICFFWEDGAPIDYSRSQDGREERELRNVMGVIIERITRHNVRNDEAVEYRTRR